MELALELELGLRLWLGVDGLGLMWYRCYRGWC